MTTERAHLSGGIEYPITSAGVIGVYLFVAHDQAVAGTLGEPVLGVSTIKATAAGEQIPVKISGEVPVYSGSDVTTNNLAVGSAVTTDAAGKAILADADTDYIVGRVSPGESTVSTADTLLKIILTHEGRIASS